MTSRTNLENLCSPNSSTHQWREKSRNEKYLRGAKTVIRARARRKAALLKPWLPFRLIGRDRITGTENGSFSNL